MLDERGSGQGSRPKKLSVFTKFEVSREQVGGSIGEVERWEVVGANGGQDGRDSKLTTTSVQLTDTSTSHGTSHSLLKCPN